MKNIKWIKRICSAALIMIMCCGIGTSAMAEEGNVDSMSKGMRRMGLSEDQLEQLNGDIQLRELAPGLSSVTITDLALDERNEIHIEVTVMGTAKSGSILCWSNGTQCVDNIKESLIITNGNKVVGERRYFHTGIFYSEMVIGRTVKAQARATNAMQPWNTISTSRNFTIPRVDM